MKKTHILTSIITLIFALVSAACQVTPGVVNKDSMDAYADIIKNSTLLIVVESIEPTGITMGYSMGTFVRHQGETYLITHNHYGDILEGMNVVELRNAENKLIWPMYAFDFKSRIVYQDAGTLVVRAPDGLEELLAPASLDPVSQLEPGDTVQVATRVQPTGDRVEIHSAAITEIREYKERPALVLSSQDGKSLYKGDSGGGVWKNGKLVANNWVALIETTVIDTSGNSEPARETPTGISYAAILPGMLK